MDPTYVPPVDHELLREPLRDTLGVVVFQDQVLDVAMALAGFTIGEAEGLRRAMSRKRSEEAIEAFRQRFIEGAARNGVDEETADTVYDKLAAFSGFGFPKSHAAAFGLLAYQSAWLRHHYPAEFLCCAPERAADGLLSAGDARARCAAARRRGAAAGREPERVRLHDRGRCRADRAQVRAGRWGRTTRRRSSPSATRTARTNVVGELARRLPLDADELEALVRVGACDCFGQAARAALAARARAAPASPVQGEREAAGAPARADGGDPRAARATVWERMLADYATTSLSVGVHPLTLLRPHLPPGALSSDELNEAPQRRTVAFAGMAVARQRPSTANGVVFMLLEDELGQMNLIVPPQVYERYRAIVRGEPLLLARGRFEHVERNRNIARRGAREPRPARPPARRRADVAARCRRRTTSGTAECRLSARPAAVQSCERARSAVVHERDVRERLREVADAAASSFGSYSSASRPRSLRSAEQPLEQRARLVEPPEQDVGCRRARTSKAGTRPRPAAGRRRSSSVVVR